MPGPSNKAMETRFECTQDTENESDYIFIPSHNKKLDLPGPSCKPLAKPTSCDVKLLNTRTMVMMNLILKHHTILAQIQLSLVTLKMKQKGYPNMWLVNRLNIKVKTYFRKNYHSQART